MSESHILMTIAILGGTGKEGKGLAYRLAKAGYRILIGSRIEDRAKAAALELLDRLSGKAFIEGTNNMRAIQSADVVILAVPYSAHRETLISLKNVLTGKLLVDITVPLVPPNVTRVQLPATGSAAQEAREILGDDAPIASAFQNISYEHLMSDEPTECDVLVTGTSKDTRAEALKLVEAAGIKGWDAGPLDNSVVAEAMTSVLIYINKQYGSKQAGIKITGVGKEQDRRLTGK
jgi:8-hydroxy-5-deazaflavin:NADPH oxidoreductase